MKTTWLALVLLSLPAIGCSGEDATDQSSTADGKDDSAITTEATPENYAGAWVLDTTVNEDTCNSYDDGKKIRQTFFIMQAGSQATVFADRTNCKSGDILEGSVVGQKLTVSGIGLLKTCHDGSEAAVISTLEMSDSNGPFTHDAKFTLELGCPDRHCKATFEGHATYLNADQGLCGSTTISTPATPPAPTPTAVPTPVGNGCDSCSLSGCCSSHGGVDYCPGTGSVICFDGTTSPGCQC